MPHYTRRSFLKAAALTATSAALWPALTGCRTARPVPPQRVRGANDTLGIAVCGFNSRGGGLLDQVLELQQAGEKVRVVALCDVDEKVLADGVKKLQGKGQAVTGYRDLRRLLEDPAVDAVIVATPNHWHALATLWAVQAGKDVYVEKPISHNVWEGRKVVEATQKYGRIVQPGTQSRSSYAIAEAVAWVRAGNLGALRIARGLCYKRRPSIGKVDGPQPIPPSIDYDLWCGPAPKTPLMRKKLHYDWHWVWPTGNGDLGNQGIHQMDIARWFLGEPALSPRVLSLGGRFGYVDDGTTPNTQIIFHDYAQAPLIFEVRGLPQKAGGEAMDKFLGGGIGVVIQCAGGHVLVPNYTSAIAYDTAGREIRKFSGAHNHMANFLQAVRSGKPAEQNAHILDGHLSSALCHTGNISYRLGRQQKPAAIREAMRAQPDGEATFQRMLEHLQLNEVDFALNEVTLGPVLAMDPKRETFPGNAAANQLLTREYRAPFVVPERV
jgi:predicted dehydrogenase